MAEEENRAVDPGPEKIEGRSPAPPEEEDVGYIEVADEVIGIVASLAALDVPGVIDMSTGFREGISNFLGKKSPRGACASR